MHNFDGLYNSRTRCGLLIFPSKQVQNLPESIIMSTIYDKLGTFNSNDKLIFLWTDFIYHIKKYNIY